MWTCIYLQNDMREILWHTFSPLTTLPIQWFGTVEYVSFSFAFVLSFYIFSNILVFFPYYDLLVCGFENEKIKKYTHTLSIVHQENEIQYENKCNQLNHLWSYITFAHI